jgi:hypothetical protein
MQQAARLDQPQIPVLLDFSTANLHFHAALQQMRRYRRSSRVMGSKSNPACRALEEIA